MKTLANQIKALARAYGKVSCRVSTYGKTCTVTFTSRPSEELVTEIRKLDTCEAHGDMMDDTRWYSGVRIQFKYAFPVQDHEESRFKELRALVDVKDFKEVYHFKQRVLSELGPFVGQCLLDRGDV